MLNAVGADAAANAFSAATDVGYFTWSMRRYWSWHGSSGSPMFLDGSNKIVGILTGGDKLSPDPDDVRATATPSRALRITDYWASWINDIRNDDPRPIDRPVLVDYDGWFLESTSTVNSQTLAPREKITVSARIFNGGTATATNGTVRFALREESVEDGSNDIFLGDVDLPDVAPFESELATLPPTAIPSTVNINKQYKVVWTIIPGSGVAEFSTEYDDLEGGTDADIDSDNHTGTLVSIDPDSKDVSVRYLSFSKLETDDFEANDEMDDASDLGVTTILSLEDLNLHSPNDLDFFKVTAGRDGVLTAAIASSSASRTDLRIQLLSDDGTVLDTGSVSDSVGISVSEGEDYFIRVDINGFGVVENYTLTIFGPPPGPDRFENNNNFAQAVSLGNLGTRTENGLNISNSSDSDMFKFVAPISGTAQATVVLTTDITDETGTFYLIVVDENDVDVGNNELVGDVAGADDADPDSDEANVSFAVTAGHTYYVIFGTYGTTGAAFYDLTVSAPIIEPDNLEPNDTFADAIRLDLLGRVTLTGLSLDTGLVTDLTLTELWDHSRQPDLDYFTFTAANDGPMTVTLQADQTLGLFQVTPYDSNNNPLLAFGEEEEGFLTVSWTVVKGATYSVRVKGKGHVTPDYSLTFDGPNAPPDAYEANDSFASATDLGLLGKVILKDLLISNRIDADYFQMVFPTPGSAAFLMRMETSGAKLSFEIYDSDHNRIHDTFVGDFPLNPNTTLTGDGFSFVKFPITPGQKYFVKVAHLDNGGTNVARYNLEVRGPRIDPDLFEPNNSFDAAAPIGTLGSVTLTNLTIDPNGPDDYYRFTAGDHGTMTVTLFAAAPNGLIDMVPCDADHNPITYLATIGANSISAAWEVTKGATYYLKVKPHNVGQAAPNYSLQFDGPAVPLDHFEPNNTVATAADLGVLAGDRLETGLNFHNPADLELFKFTAATSGIVTASVTAFSAPGVVAVAAFDGAAIEALTSDDDEIKPLDLSQGPSGTQTVTFAVLAGKSYYLFFDQRSVNGFYQNPAYDLSISTRPRPFLS